jgi:hypothetical protein
VRRWQVLTGSEPGALSPAGTGPRTGFESAISVPGNPAFVAVRALDAVGHRLGTSATVAG